ncbi:phosphatidylinositol phosphatase PTPRQ-like [Anneissia japonica]|uniref:phosphatidylinositol phosphatase PTPRQ-like n=1 Tax=Anneissia japonica TaxID=1529436 RepID=UPI001425B06C|nr:phosphatidylinositol phosphatase PTPRQ-like [Anneissia japonica]
MTQAPGPVQNIKVFVDSDDRIIVKWDAPTAKNGKITAYNVTYIERRSGTVRSINTHLQTYTFITNLNPYTNYIIMVSAKTTKLGKVSTVNATTHQTAPSGPPMNITYRMSETDLIFNWKEPSEDKKNGVIIKYRYQLYEGNSSAGTMVKDALTTNRRVIFQECEANKLYTFRIRAYTIKGDGPWSNDFIALTTPPSSTQTPAALTRSDAIVLPPSRETAIPDTQKNTSSSLQDRLGIIVAAILSAFFCLLLLLV